MITTIMQFRHWLIVAGTLRKADIYTPGLLECGAVHDPMDISTPDNFPVIVVLSKYIRPGTAFKNDDMISNLGWYRVRSGQGRSRKDTHKVVEICPSYNPSLASRIRMHHGRINDQTSSEKLNKEYHRAADGEGTVEDPC